MTYALPRFPPATRGGGPFPPPRRAVRNYGRCDPREREDGRIHPGEVGPVDPASLAPDPSSLDRWRAELPPDDRDYYAATCGDLMERFGLPV